MLENVLNFGRRLPDFLIIGTQKGGTTSLYKYLTSHTDILSGEKKEVHFFDLNYSKGINWYRGFFPYKFKGINKIVGEASPYYLFHPLVPERVHSIMPNIKLIVLLRNPIDRAFSHYNMEVNRGVEYDTFEKAIENEKERIYSEIEKIKRNPNNRSYVHQNFSYLTRGHYYEQIVRWLDYFPKEQLYINSSERFYAQPQLVVNDILDFLGLEKKANICAEILMKGNYKNTMLLSTKQKLEKYFKPYNEQLYSLIDEKYNW